MLKMTGTALLGTALLGPSVFAGEADKTEKKESKKSRKPKALIIGAHPDGLWWYDARTEKGRL